MEQKELARLKKDEVGDVLDADDNKNTFKKPETGKKAAAKAAKAAKAAQEAESAKE